MLKVMRKYNKVILVVGGTLLMIAFLMPQAISQLGRARMGKSVGMMDGHKITYAQYDLALREVRALEAFFAMGNRSFPIVLEKGKETEHWLLLKNEAEKAGLVGGADEGETLLPVLAREMVWGDYQRQYGQSAEWAVRLNPDQFEQDIATRHQILAMARPSAAAQGRMQPEEFDEALARMRGVWRMLNMYMSAERLSDRQTVALANKLADSVLIDAVLLDARDLLDPSVEPTPEQLQAHFERFKDVQPGSGEFSIGFLLPPRVKLEWIELDRVAMSQAVKISMIDATKHWQQNRDTYPGLFEAERAKVEDELRRAEVDQIMNTAETVVRSGILTAVRALDEEGVYRVVPADWAQRRPDFMKLAEQVVDAVRDRHGVTIPLPGVYIRDDKWLDGGMVQNLPGIGSSSVTYEGQRLSFAQAVMAVRELAGENVLGVQEMVPPADLPSESPLGARYYFNVLDTAPEAVPESIDQLLNPERVKQSWEALQFYEQTVAKADEIASLVEAEGLEAYAKSFGQKDQPELPEGAVAPPAEDKVSVQANARVTEAETTVAGLQQSTEVIEQVREAGRAINPKTPIDDVPLGDRVVVVPVPSKLGVLVAQINGVEPLTRETRPRAADYARRFRARELFQGIGLPYPYHFPVLEERHGFSLKAWEDDPDSEDEAGSGAEPEAETPVEGESADGEPTETESG